MKQLTVNEIVEELKKSQGFVMFVSFAKMNEDTKQIVIEHRYMRQQFIAEDLPEVSKQFRNMVSNDIAEVSMNMMRKAQEMSQEEPPILRDESEDPTGREHTPT